MADGFDGEDDLQQRQGGALYPVGRTLRATYDADNHDTLGSDITGLMLELTRVPFEPCARDAAPVPPAPPPAPSLLTRVRGLLRR